MPFEPTFDAAGPPELHGRVSKLESRVTAVELRQDGFEYTVKQNTDAVQAGARISAENALTLQKILLFVSGQQDPGLKVPSLLERMEVMQTKMEELATSYAALKATDTSRKGWLAGVATIVTLVGGAVAAYFYETFHTLLAFIKHIPPTIKP